MVTAWMLVLAACLPSGTIKRPMDCGPTTHEGAVALCEELFREDAYPNVLTLQVLVDGDAQAVANVVSNESTVDVGLEAKRSVAGSIQVIVNARVATDPEILENICRSNVESIAEKLGAGRPLLVGWAETVVDSLDHIYRSARVQKLPPRRRITGR